VESASIFENIVLETRQLLEIEFSLLENFSGETKGEYGCSLAG
jgi:hypothetical protein